MFTALCIFEDGKPEFIKYLENAKGKILSVRHHPKTNNAYQELNDIEREVRYQCVTYFKLSWEEFEKGGITRDLQISSNLLKRYSHKGSDKTKLSQIEEFKKEYAYDVGKMIFDLGYQPKENINPEG